MYICVICMSILHNTFFFGGDSLEKITLVDCLKGQIAAHIRVPSSCPNICVSLHLRHLCILSYSGLPLKIFWNSIFSSCFKDIKLWLIYFGQGRIPEESWFQCNPKRDNWRTGKLGSCNSNSQWRRKERIGEIDNIYHVDVEMWITNHCLRQDLLFLKSMSLGGLRSFLQDGFSSSLVLDFKGPVKRGTEDPVLAELKTGGFKDTQKPFILAWKGRHSDHEAGFHWQSVISPAVQTPQTSPNTCVWEGALHELSP